MEVSEIVNNYKCCFPDEFTVVQKLKEFIENNEYDHFDRKNMDGHITASGIVINKGKILMIKHPYINLLLAPGGHVEKGETPIDTVIREVKEETGYIAEINDLFLKMKCPINIDMHVIPKNEKKRENEHIHFDFSFILDLSENVAVDKSELLTCWVEIENAENMVIKNILRKIKEVKFNEWCYR